MTYAHAACFTLLCAAPLGAQQRPPVLDTVAIVATRTSAPDHARSTDVVTREAIARSAARTVADVLSTVMGVDVYGRSAAQADVSIRGSSAEQVVVLVDGVRMTDVQSAHYTLDLAVPLVDVERIEVLRGAGSALYGPDAVGGVINIVTRRTSPTRVFARSGSFGNIGGEVTSGLARGRLAVAGSADFEKSDGHRDGTDYRLGQGRVSATAPVRSGTLKSNLALGVRDFGAADFYAPYNSVERTTTTTFDSHWDVPVGAWSVDVGGSTRRHQDHYVLVRDNPSLYENRHESWQTGGELVARGDAGPLAIALGAEGAHDQLSSARLGGHREWRGAVFAEATLARPNYAANVGVRGDHSSGYGDFLSPSVSVSASVAPWLRVRSSGGAGFRAPTWTERFYTDPSNLGNPDLAPERFWTVDLGARASLGAWSFDASAFTRRATHLIDWVKDADTPSAVWSTMNVGRATYHGLEAALNLPSTRGIAASVFGSWSTLDATEGERLVGKYALRPVTQQAGLRLSSPPGRSWTASVDVAHARRATEASYLTGDARLAWARRAVRFTLDVRNLTDAEWLDASGKPAAGRGVYAGIEWTR